MPPELINRCSVRAACPFAGRRSTVSSDISITSAQPKGSRSIKQGEIEKKKMTHTKNEKEEVEVGASQRARYIIVIIIEFCERETTDLK